MLCRHHREIVNTFWTRGPALSSCAGSCKWWGASLRGNPWAFLRLSFFFVKWRAGALPQIHCHEDWMRLWIISALYSKWCPISIPFFLAKRVYRNHLRGFQNSFAWVSLWWILTPRCGLGEVQRLGPLQWYRGTPEVKKSSLGFSEIQLSRGEQMGREKLMDHYWSFNIIKNLLRKKEVTDNAEMNYENSSYYQGSYKMFRCPFGLTNTPRGRGAVDKRRSRPRAGSRFELIVILMTLIPYSIPVKKW